jgi:hypothetical protein
MLIVTKRFISHRVAVPNCWDGLTGMKWKLKKSCPYLCDPASCAAFFRNG